MSLKVISTDLDGDGIFDDPLVVNVPDEPPPPPVPVKERPVTFSHSSAPSSSKSFSLPSWRVAKKILIAVGVAVGFEILYWIIMIILAKAG